MTNSFSNRFICLYVSENILGSNIARCCQGSSRNLNIEVIVKYPFLSWYEAYLYWVEEMLLA